MGEIINTPGQAAAADRIARLQTVTAALSGSLTPEQVAAVVVELGAAALGANAGGVSVLDAEKNELRLLRVAGYSSDIVEPWQRIPLDAPVPVTEAIRERRPIFIHNAEEWKQNYPLLVEKTGHADPNEARAALPLLMEDRVVGCIGLTFPTPRSFTSDEQDFMQVLARQCAQALDRALLYDEARKARASAEAAQQRMTILAEASATMSVSLEYQETLRNVAKIAVPRLADWCAVDMPSADGKSIERLAVAHVDPAKVQWAHEINRRYPVKWENTTGVAKVLREGITAFFPEITDEMLVAGTRDEEHLSIARAVGLESYICVPLAARGRILGALTFVTTRDSGRRYTAEDVALAQELARRAALDVDNALLYQEAKQEREATTAILESITDTFYTMDTDWNFTFLNSRAVQYFGRSREDLLGKKLWDVFPVLVGSEIYHAYHRARREGVSVNVETLSPFSQRWLQIRAYPSVSGLSIYFRDTTEEHQAREALQQSMARQREFVKEVLASVSEGRLILCDTPDELPAPLPQIGESMTLTRPSLRRFRGAVNTVAMVRDISEERRQDLETAVGESAMNAVVHGGGSGTGRVHASDDIIQIWVEDQGTGIDMERIPQATLVRGVSYGGGLGHGFWMMLKTVDRVYLLTGPQGTTVVIEQDRTPVSEPGWLGNYSDRHSQEPSPHKL